MSDSEQPSYMKEEVNQAIWLQWPIDAARTIFKQAMETSDDDANSAALDENLYWKHRVEYEEDGVKMVELPVFAFTHQQTQDFLADDDEQWKQLGGKPSVRKDPNKKIELWFGQGESTFSSHAMNENCWQVDGVKPERSKGEGTGEMVSAMQSFAFGFGLTITKLQFEQINALRKGEFYKDEEAANDFNGDALKRNLSSSPFSVLFDYGKAKSGFWGYRHMICQLEDCVDCLRVLFPGKNEEKFLYDFVFEFDHSAGHAKKRPNGLSANSPNIHYGGKQAVMRDTIITDEETELGSCPERVLNVGDVQSFVFVQGGAPPIANPDAPEMDVIIGPPKEETKSAAALKEELKALGLHQLAFGKAADVRQRAANAGLSLTKNVSGVKEGYVGKAKGLKQIVWERGFWSASELRIPGYVKADEMRLKLASCYDFATELSQMQWVAEQIGVRVVMTPKAHPELAGQGIEYSWGYAKLCFRRMNTARTSKEKAQAKSRSKT